MIKSAMFKPHIRQTVPYVGGSVRSEAQPGKKIVKLSSNENMLGASPRALKAIKNSLSFLHEYNYQDDSRFREALSCHFDFAIDPEQFLTANSGMELLDLICRGFLEPGDECILSTPTFLAYKSFATVAGATVIDVPLRSKDFSIAVENILAAVTPKTKLIFISSPNNPTGSIVRVSEMNKLLESLPKNIIIVYDEVYHHYVDHPAFARAVDFIKKGAPVIGLHSFSKAYGLAGIRLGYAFGTIEIMQYLRQLRRPFMINTISMEAGIAALGDEEHIQMTTALIEQEKAWLYQELGRLRLCFWPSHANFILFRSPYDARDLAAGILESGVMVRTGEVFGAPDCIRVTIGTRAANAAFINILKLLV
jgi:histidinol-phosphate aminotransferase